MSASLCHISDLTTKNDTVFTSQSASGRSTFLLPLIRYTISSSTMTCMASFSYLGITPVVSAFSWVAAISLGLLTCVRVTETIKSDGRLIFARNDVSGLRPMSTGDDAEDCMVERRLNGLKVLVGVRLWEAHFEFVI